MAVASLLDFTFRLLVALALGSIVGAERQYRQRMAGLRTNALVSVGAALFVMLSALGTRGDPTRIAAQVVSGIGFLAGAVIFKEGLSVTGLNTAATMWATAAVGALAGFGYSAQAAIGAGVVLFVHVVLRPVVQRINRQPDDQTDVAKTYEIHALCRQDVEERVRTALIAAVRQQQLTLHAVYSDDLEPAGRVEVVADVAAVGRTDSKLESVVTRLGIEPGVTAVNWKLVPATPAERLLLPES